MQRFQHYIDGNFEDGSKSFENAGFGGTSRNREYRVEPAEGAA